MARWLVLACALMVGAVAPARAWCEATCLASSTNTPSHCPAHDSGDGTATLSPGTVDQCPVLESARPAASARLDVHATIARIHVPSLTAPTHFTPSFDRSHQPTTVFERCTPLRI